MTKPDKLILILIFCFLHLSSFGQDLKKAVIDFYINTHFNFDKDLISGNKIKLIEKHQLSFNDDTLRSDILIEKHQFNTNGFPDYVYYKPVGGFDKSEIRFKYDSEGNLIKKEVYGISPSLNYKLIEWYEWFYSNGLLTKESRYLLTDKIDVEKGAHYFPEKFFLFKNDTIFYNINDTSCLVVSNNPEHCKADSISLYPPSFKNIINTTLKFHSNNRIYSKTTERESVIQKRFYDRCGNPMSGRMPNTKCLARLSDKSQCLPQEKIRICNESDTVTLNNQLVYFVKSESSRFQHDSGPGGTIIHKGISYYNPDFNIISSIDTTTYIRGSMFDERKYSEFKTIRISTYEYFENGLLKKVINKNENGKIIEVIEFKIEYYE